MSEYGCREFRETQFTPICDYKPLTGTEPLALEIPMPVFPAAIPPDDCVCFTFESEHEEVDVITVTKDVKPHCYVEIEQAGNDCCEGKYKVTPHIEVPACLYPDDTGWKQADTTGAHLGNFGLQYRTVNCGLEMKVVGSIPEPPCVPTPDPDTFSLPIVYEDASGETQEENITFTIKFPKDKDHPCRWCIDDPDPLDFRKMNIGKYNNNGAVFSPADGSGAGGGGLYIDGTIDEADTTWYGGGFGNVGSGELGQLTAVYRRGYLMRNDPRARHGGLPIVVGGYANQKYVSKQGVTVEEWYSTTKTDTGALAEGLGYLNLALPSGLQWAYIDYGENPRFGDETIGVGVTFTIMEITPSGIVGRTTEHKEMALISPAPVYRIGGGQYQNNASGLRVRPPETFGTISYSGGLSVMNGGGLRIQVGTTEDRKPVYRYPDVSDNSLVYQDGAVSSLFGGGLCMYAGNSMYENPKVASNGLLEHIPGEMSVMIGDGLRIYAGKDSSNVMQYEYPSPTRLPGEVGINYGRGMRMTNCSGSPQNNKLELSADTKDFAFIQDSSSAGKTVENAKLVLNDTKTTSTTKLLNVASLNPEGSKIGWTRNTNDLVVKFCIAVIDTGYEYKHYFGYMHFSSNGVLLAVTSSDEVEITRRCSDETVINACPL